ncbi:MAG: hypothetical protein LBB98_05600 [Treponema sp.]|jgi:hypothetical protein|nr:hypothetical protein [Treponema sp.]
MMVDHAASFFFRLFLLLMGLAFAGGCTPRTRPAPPEAETGGGEPSIPRSLLAIVKSGEAPLWFEFTADGPDLIPGPAEASEEPFVPWPQARYAAGFAVDGKWRLVMAVNRDGFLVWEIREDGLGLYRIAGPEAWDPYTAASLFMYRDTPAALLYRDDFFLRDGEKAPDPPVVRVWGLGADLLTMGETEIPAFAALSPVDGWDLDVLSLGRDGLWYYRGVHRGASPEIRYFRTWDLAVPGEASSAGVFRNAMTPYTEKDMPLPIWAALEEAGRTAGEGKTLVAAVVSPEFPARRYFALKRDVSGEGEILELAGFYRPPDAVALVFPNGRGIAVGLASAPEVFTLPVLPEGFVYTRIGFAGSVLIVSWEEQLDWQIGAAGFMVVNGP